MAKVGSGVIDPTTEAAEDHGGSSTLQIKKGIFGLHFIGNSILLWGELETHFPWHGLVGPHWPVMLLSYGLIIGISLVYLILLAFHMHLAIGIIGIFTLTSTVTAFTFTAFSNPGIVMPSSPSLELDESGTTGTSTECGICMVQKPPGAFHCYACKTCCEQLDHHW
ncbi:unnamed protein product [Heterosigma akashiwo]